MWDGLFLISIAQSVFLLSLMIIKIKEKGMDFYLLTLLLLALTVTNIDFFFISSNVYISFPYAFGSSFGLMLLFGPIFYLYTRTTIYPEFSWRPSLLLHFVPYILNLLLNIPVYLTSSAQKIQFINGLLEDGIQLRIFDKILIGFQCLHFLIYLMVTQTLIKTLKPTVGNVAYIVALNKRIQWVKVLFHLFLAYEGVVFLLLLQVVVFTQLYVEVNYTYTLLSSAIIYLLAYAVILNPDLLNPGFVKRYKNSREDSKEVEQWMVRLSMAINEKKIYRDTELSLESLANEIEVPKNQLSRLINERLQKSFNDYVNDFRIQEFITLYNNPDYHAYNIYGIALETGFKNKSTFNTAFKKFTGKTPTEYKRMLALSQKK